jgi:hypothetical protein
MNSDNHIRFRLRPAAPDEGIIVAMLCELLEAPRQVAS